MMDLDEIKQILEMMREHDLAEFELERDDMKIRLRKAAGGNWISNLPLPQAPYAAPVPPQVAAPGAPPAAAVPVLTTAD
jgi:acetyl-CoA carboxylase biotin carboxyl carrier protein